MALLAWDERIKSSMDLHGLRPPGSTPRDIAQDHAAVFFRALASTPNWVSR